MNKRALSLIEVVVAMFILSATMAGAVNIFISAKRYIRHSRCRIQAANLARYHLDPFFQSSVRFDQWDGNIFDYFWGNPLRKEADRPGNLVWLDNIPFSSLFTITVPPNFDSSRSEMRKVRLTIGWVEPAPWVYY